MPLDELASNASTIDRILLKNEQPLIDSILDRKIFIVSRDELNHCLSINLNRYLVPTGPIKLSIADWAAYNKTLKRNCEFYNFVRVALKVPGETVIEKIMSSYILACESNHSHIMNFLEVLFPLPLAIPSVSEVMACSRYMDVSDASLNRYQLFAQVSSQSAPVITKPNESSAPSIL